LRGLDVVHIESITQTHIVYIIKKKKKKNDKKKKGRQERKKGSYLCRGEERRFSRTRKGGNNENKS